MYNDLECPHCEEGFDVYDIYCEYPKEDIIHEDECPYCKKKFKWRWYYSPEHEIIEKELDKEIEFKNV